MDRALEIVTDNGWAVEVFLIVLATAATRYVAKILFDRLARKLEQTHDIYDDALLVNPEPGPAPA